MNSTRSFNTSQKPTIKKINSNNSTSMQGNISGHWIGQKTIVACKNMCLESRRYIQQTCFNMNYRNMEHFRARARAFMHYLPKETKLFKDVQQQIANYGAHISSTTSGNLNSNASNSIGNIEKIPALPNEIKLSSEILHFQRGMFGNSLELQNAKQLKNDRTLDDALQGDAVRLIKMFQKNIEGPLTYKQSQYGFEVANASVYLQPKEIREKIEEHRIRANRNNDKNEETHQTTSQFGVDLQNDLGSQLSDELGLPVMSGISGTASLVVCSHHYAMVNATPDAKTLQRPNNFNNKTLSNLGLIYFREKSSMAKSFLKKAINTCLQKFHGNKLEALQGKTVQSHSYPEIYAGVDLTHKTLTQNTNIDEKTYQQSLLEAKEVLDSITS